MSDSLQPHGLQHTRIPCPSLSPRACSNPCPLSRWCHPTISSCFPLLLLPSIFPSIRVFSNESALLIMWPKDWSFSISPSNEYPGLISFRIDWLYLLAVQGTLKSLLQHHSLKSSILQCSAFFMVQLSHQYMTTERNIKRSLAQKRVQMVSGLHHLLYDFRQITLVPQFLHLYQKCYSRICETNVWKALSSAHGTQSKALSKSMKQK